MKLINILFLVAFVTYQSLNLNTPINNLEMINEINSSGTTWIANL